MKKQTVVLTERSRHSPVGKFYHPLKYLAEVSAVDCRRQITTIANMPYPADPLVEPEFVGLTYYQVGVIRQMELAARYSSLDAMEFISDRIIGKPAQVNVNVNADENSYQKFLKDIALAEGDIIEVDGKVVPAPTEEWKLE